jgi:hypothetical protein
MAKTAVVDTATGAVIKWGFVDFSGEYDPATQTIVPLAEDAVPIEGIPQYYQKIVDLFFVEMTEAEKLAVRDAGIAPPEPNEIVFGLGYFWKIGTTDWEAWNSSPSTGANLTTGALEANKIYAMPVPVPVGLRIDRIAINVTGAVAGGLARLGVAKDLNGRPDKIAYDAGEISVATTGNKKISGTKRLWPGLNWLLVASNAAITIRCFTPAGLLNLMGFDASLPNNPRFGWSAPWTYGAAFPNRFPASPTLLTAAPLPTIWVRSDLQIFTRTSLASR